MSPTRRTFLRDLEAGPLLDLVPVMAVLSVLLMLAALVMLLAYLDNRARRLAAAGLRLALLVPGLAPRPVFLANVPLVPTLLPDPDQYAVADWLQLSSSLPGALVLNPMIMAGLRSALAHEPARR